MSRFEGKVALVTGGGTGIGRATAIAFAREGAKVVIGNRNTERGGEVVDAIAAEGGEASFVRTDVTVESDIEALVQFTLETHGRIDCAFNNSGIEGKPAPTVDGANDNFQAVMDVNVRGVWWCMKYEIPPMLEAGGGAIVNCSSVAGVIGVAGLGHYVASKHAVMGLTKCAALEYAEAGIRVNAVNPAVIKTGMADRLIESLGMNEEDVSQMHPVGRWGTSEEVAEAVLYLCSDGAAFTTGQALLVDGGYTAR